MSELLKSTESIKTPTRDNNGGPAKLYPELINSLILERKEVLAKIKGEVSRKVYFQIEEKIAREEKELKEIMDWQNGKISQLSKYTFILDPHYFEQEFLN